MILELCKGVYCVDLDESFQTHIYLQNLASIQPRTSPLKFVGSLAPAEHHVEGAEVLVGRGDVTLADDPQLGTLRSTCAEVIAQLLETGAAKDTNE